MYFPAYRMALNYMSSFSDANKITIKLKYILDFKFKLFIVIEIEKCEKKLHPLTSAAKTQRHIKKKFPHNLTPLTLRLIFCAGVSLRRFLPPFIAIKNNKAAGTQRQIKNNLSSLYWSFFFACVSLRYFFKYLHSSKSKTAALGAQWKNISIKDMGYLKLKINYVIASVVSSGLVCHRTPTSNIYSRKGTGGGESHMILTFFVNDKYEALVANNTNVTASCTLRLICNVKNFIIKKGPQTTQNVTLRSGSATKHERHRSFYFLLILSFFCVFCVVCGPLSFMR